MTPAQLRHVEQCTREQRYSTEWFSVRRYRITASHFGEILHRRRDTPPDRLVLSILMPRKFSSPATTWGIENESRAIQAYIEHKQSVVSVNLLWDHVDSSFVTIILFWGQHLMVQCMIPQMYPIPLDF